MEFFIPMEPPTTTFQAKQINWKKKVVYDSQEIKNIKQKFESYLYKFKPEKPLEGAIEFSTVWIYKSKTKETKPKITKPDLDNMNKLLQDAMTKLQFWKDDSQITRLTIEKWWGEVPGIWIRIEESEDD